MIVDIDKPFEGILGNSSEVNVIEYLLSCPTFSFNITELSKAMLVSRATITTIIRRLLKWDMIVIEKEIGNIKLYKLNQKSFLINDMESFNNNIIQIIETKEFGSAANIVTTATSIYSSADIQTNEDCDLGYADSAISVCTTRNDEPEKASTIA